MRTTATTTVLAGIVLAGAAAAVAFAQSSRAAVLWDLTYVLEIAHRIRLGEVPYAEFVVPAAAADLPDPGRYRLDRRARVHLAPPLLRGRSRRDRPADVADHLPAAGGNQLAACRSSCVGGRHADRLPQRLCHPAAAVLRSRLHVFHRPRVVGSARGAASWRRVAACPGGRSPRASAADQAEHRPRNARAGSRRAGAFRDRRPRSQGAGTLHSPAAGNRRHPVGRRSRFARVGGAGRFLPLDGGICRGQALARASPPHDPFLHTPVPGS